MRAGPAPTRPFALADGPGDAGGEDLTAGGFEVHLDNFSGPFDLLLSLIARHRLDVTEVALATVTDEFVAHIRAADTLDLDEATAFVVVAATLLDLKAARLLPGAEVEDAADLALLESRDLLVVRLLQYRAFRAAADDLAARLEATAGRVARTRGSDAELDAALRELVPEPVWTLGPGDLAALAAAALRPRPQPEVDVTHAHGPAVSVAGQRDAVLAALAAAGDASGGACALADLLRAARREGGTGVLVARFLAVLELYRDGVLDLDHGADGAVRVRPAGPEPVLAGAAAGAAGLVAP